MDRGTQEIWERLRNLAHETLVRGVATRRGYEPIIQLLVLPSFTAPTSLDVFRLHGDAAKIRSYVGTRSVWSMHDDHAHITKPHVLPVERLRRQADPIPTITYSDVVIDEAKTDALVQQVRGLSLAVLPAETKAGCDGISYELYFQNHFSQSRFHWWVEAPSSWRRLDEIRDVIFGLFGHVSEDR